MVQQNTKTKKKGDSNDFIARIYAFRAVTSLYKTSNSSLESVKTSNSLLDSVKTSQPY